jgi:hypothetical protein
VPNGVGAFAGVLEAKRTIVIKIRSDDATTLGECTPMKLPRQLRATRQELLRSVLIGSALDTGVVVQHLMLSLRT